MKKKILNYDLIYYEKGKEQNITLKISFISNYFYDKYSEIMAKIWDVQSKWDQISDNTSLMAGLTVNKPDGYKEKLNGFETENKKFANEIKNSNIDEIQKERFELIEHVLESNGIDGKLLSYDFWNKNVDPATIIDFIIKCHDKDCEKKNKIAV